MILEMGMAGADVRNLQNILIAQGFAVEQTGIFDHQTDEQVRRFQTTHIGQDGKFLEADGKVGPITQWALTHPSGNAQCNGLYSPIPEGLTPMRNKVLTLALDQRRLGVHEVPNGANWGGGIEKYGGRPGWSWCCLFVTWVWRNAGIIDFKEASTWTMLQIATKKGWFYPLRSDDARATIPGNAFIWQHGNRTGHISLIFAVDESGKHFNTIGGNEGNRVKFGVRDLDSKDLVGTINPFGPTEQPSDFKRGIVSAKSVESDTTR